MVGVFDTEPVDGVVPGTRLSKLGIVRVRVADPRDTGGIGEPSKPKELR